MEDILNGCDPSIFDRKDLMSDEGVFITKDMIKNKCVCLKKNACIEIVRALKENNPEYAFDLLIKMKGLG